MKNFSEIIKEERKIRNYTQETLAEELGVSKSTVAMWETGERYPGKELCEHLADLFNVDIDYLYGRTDIKKKYHISEYGDEYINANYIGNDNCEYFAQKLFDDDMKLLFDMRKTTQFDELMRYAKYLKKIHDEENKL